MGKRMSELKLRAELIEDQIETIFIEATGTAEDQSRLDGLYYDLALVEEELNTNTGCTAELLDNSFDDLDAADYELLNGKRGA